MQPFWAMLLLCSAVSCAAISDQDVGLDMYGPDPAAAYDMAFAQAGDMESLDDESPDARQFGMLGLGGLYGLGGLGYGYGGLGYGGFGYGRRFFDEDTDSQNDQVSDSQQMPSKYDIVKIPGHSIKKIIIKLKKDAAQEMTEGNQVSGLKGHRFVIGAGQVSMPKDQRWLAGRQPGTQMNTMPGQRWTNEETPMNFPDGEGQQMNLMKGQRWGNEESQMTDAGKGQEMQTGNVKGERIYMVPSSIYKRLLRTYLKKHSEIQGSQSVPVIVKKVPHDKFQEAQLIRNQPTQTSTDARRVFNENLDEDSGL